MHQLLHKRHRGLLEVLLPVYSIAVVVYYFRPQYLSVVMGGTSGDSIMPWAILGLVGAMGGVLAVSALAVAFFLLYSPVYLVGSSWKLVGKGAWVDRREVRFYVGCFLLLCLLAGLAVWSAPAAVSTFVLVAGSAHFLWRALA